MGKWDILRGKYPKLPLEGGYLDKVNAILDSPAPKDVLGPAEEDLELSIRMLSDFQLNKLYVKCRNRADELNVELTQLNLEEEAYTRAFIDRFEEAGTTKVDFENGTQIGVSVEPYPFVKDQAAMLAWIKKNGMEAMLTLNWQTMASMVKDRLSGKVKEPLPDGVEVFMKDKLSCRGRNKGSNSTQGEL